MARMLAIALTLTSFCVFGFDEDVNPTNQGTDIQGAPNWDEEPPFDGEKRRPNKPTHNPDEIGGADYYDSSSRGNQRNPQDQWDDRDGASSGSNYDGATDRGYSPPPSANSGRRDSGMVDEYDDEQ